MRRDVVNRSQNWRDLTPTVKLLISLVVTAGTGVLLSAAINPISKNIAQFICYLLIALLASRLKVNLPGITGTMSVNFLFILLGILELSFTETLVLGTAAILVQCFYRDRPSAIQVTFNICASAFSIRSEEHTSELQSPDHLVCRLLLEKKNKSTQLHVCL